jgi:hypothetical protein
MSVYPKHYYVCKHIPSWTHKCDFRTQTQEKMKEHCDKQPDNHCNKMCHLEPIFESYSPEEKAMEPLPCPNKFEKGGGGAGDESTNSSVYFIF